jgi:hypothetical protein
MSLLSLCMIFWTNKLNQTKLNLHQPSVNVTKYQKRVPCIGVQVSNVLPFYIKAESDNPKNFKAFYKNTYVKIPFIPWMYILHSKVKFDM